MTQPYDISPLLDLKIAVFRLPFATDRMLAPLDMVPAFRSRLGQILKQRFCPYPGFGTTPCEGCNRLTTCCYPLLFAPTCQVIEPDLSGPGHCHVDPPRPYTLSLSQPDGERAAALVLTLIGDMAIDFRRPMLESLLLAAQAPLVWQALRPSSPAIDGDAILKVDPGATLGDWIRALPDPGLARSGAGANLLELVFTSPVQDKRLERTVGLSPLLKSIVSRLRDLKRIYHPDNDMGRFSESFFKAAEGVTVFSSLEFEKATWFSTHRDRAISLGGLKGRLMLKGDLAPYIPILAAGYFLGIGSKTVYGLGRFSTDGWT